MSQIRKVKLMCKKLGIVEHALYCNDDNKYYDCVDDLLTDIECDHDEEPGEIIERKCEGVIAYQYWFPTVKYVQEKIKKGKPLPTIDNIIDDIILISDVMYEDDNYVMPELNNVPEFMSELSYYWQHQDDIPRLEQALEAFRASNEQVNYWESNSKIKSIHLFKVLDNHDIEYLGEKEMEPIKEERPVFVDEFINYLLIVNDKGDGETYELKENNNEGETIAVHIFQVVKKQNELGEDYHDIEYKGKKQNELGEEYHDIEYKGKKHD